MPIGSSFDDFLKVDGTYEEVTAKAHKRLLAIQLSEAMERGSITKKQLAARLQTSRQLTKFRIQRARRSVDWLWQPNIAFFLPTSSVSN